MPIRIILYAITSLVSIGISAGSNFGSYFGASLLGNIAGNAVYNTIAQPRQSQPQVVERTVYVQQAPQQPRYPSDSHAHYNQSYNISATDLNKNTTGAQYGTSPARPSNSYPARTKQQLEEENRRLREELRRVHQ